MSLHLVIGNKNYSSWSFRPWLAMKVAGIRFDETVGSLDPTPPLEAPLAVKEFEALGVAHERITAEEQSRNTIENAVFSRLLADPKPGERWVLVTSASHMPRAIAAFRAAGFPVEAYPVNWHTQGRRDAAELFTSFAGGLAMTDYAVHEWFGLAAYWLTGRTSELFPAP